MMAMKPTFRAFTKHPASVGETYIEHMGSAFYFAGTMLAASIACFIHGLFPFLCVKTGSKAVTLLHHRMVTHRSRLTEVAAPSET